jgi:hypothetical protein
VERIAINDSRFYAVKHTDRIKVIYKPQLVRIIREVDIYMDAYEGETGCSEDNTETEYQCGVAPAKLHLIVENSKCYKIKDTTMRIMGADSRKYIWIYVRAGARKDFIYFKIWHG